MKPDGDDQGLVSKYAIVMGKVVVELTNNVTYLQSTAVAFSLPGDSEGCSPSCVSFIGYVPSVAHIVIGVA